MSKTWNFSLLSLAAALWVASPVFSQTTFTSIPSQSPANPAAETVAPGQPIVPNSAAVAPATTPRPSLGVRIRQAKEGVTVVAVYPEGAAERAGFQPGDEIRYVANHQVRTTEELTAEIQKAKPGTSVDMFVVRRGEPQVLTVAFPGPPVNPGQQPATQQQVQVLSQQVNQLNQQLYYQNQEINRLRSFRMIRIPPTDPADYQWWLRVQRGETNNDPAIFQ